MRNINFKLKNKNDSQMKNEILSKMKQVKKIIQDDMKYESLFYDVVNQAHQSKEDIKLDFTQSGGNFFCNTLGLLCPSDESFKQESNDAVNESNDNNNDNNDNNNDNNDNNDNNESNDSNSESNDSNSESNDSNNESNDSNSESNDSNNDNNDNNENNDNNKKNDNNREENGNDKNEDGEYNDNEFEKYNDKNEPVSSLGGKKSVSISDLFLGGNKEDFSDDESQISLSDDDLSYNPHTTLFYEEDEESLMDHIKNMTSKKYLKNLKVEELKEILRKNNQKITEKGNYLSKINLIKKIIKMYK